MNAAQLIDWARLQRRDGTPDGDIGDRVVLVDVLTQLLDEHLERTAPQGTPPRSVEAPSGFYTLPAQPPRPRKPQDADETAKQLATLIGYIEEVGA
jgi:hypothetical protein